MGSFLPIFSLLPASVVELGSATGQTDRRTDDDHQRLVPQPTGAMHSKVNSVSLYIKRKVKEVFTAVFYKNIYVRFSTVSSGTNYCRGLFHDVDC